MDAAPQETTRYDPAKARKAVRFGRERGVRIYLSAAELRKAGIDPHGDTPTYKVWGREKGSILVRLYR